MIAAMFLPQKREAEKKYSFTKDTMKRLARNKLTVIGMVILSILILSAIFAPLIVPYDYAEQNILEAYMSPCREHLFGTDEFGRDIFSRVLMGGRLSLVIGFIAVAIAIVFGGLLGAIAGYFQGAVDNVIMRFVDILMSIPQLLLAIAITATLGSSLLNLMIAVGIAAVPGYARIVRASVLSVRDQEFVEAARAVGTSDFKIIMKHILPNCLAPIIVKATLDVAICILSAAGMSFIGIGLQPPSPEWGAMLSDARYYIRDYSYMALFPGLCIALTIFSLNVLGDGLRDALDPKLRD
ncbi:MAG: ABC transporter permease [Oscillospiraceae bacterium]|nr:ABC transporter permease [Oscillospiraceae bacterium]